MAALATWGLDEVFLARTRAGTDNALRLAAILTYVGVDSWYTLARALGITALAFSYLSVLLAFEVARRRASGAGAADRTDTLSTLHRQLSLVSLVLVAGHAVAPFGSVFYPYEGWRTSFVPFAQPVSWGIQAASWESLGILAFYLGILMGPTYYLLRGRAAWVRVHRLAFVVYGLSVGHAFLLGSDFLVDGPARVALLAAQVPLCGLAAWRLAPAGRASGAAVRPRLRWAGAGVAAGAAAALAVLVGLVAAGGVAPGRVL